MKKIVITITVAFVFGTAFSQDITTKKPSHQKDSIVASSHRNVFAVGYQIGGLTLVGFEYEIRVHDYFGINIGAGFRGYTGGIKIHTFTKKNSPFFLLSYKDCGFGLMNTAGVEYGRRLIVNKKKDIGFIFQIGLAKILDINADFEKIVYKGKPAPAMTLSVGIGFSW